MMIMKCDKALSNKQSLVFLIVTSLLYIILLKRNEDFTYDHPHHTHWMKMEYMLKNWLY